MICWAECSGAFLTPPPPAEKATARQDQAREASTGDGTGNGIYTRETALMIHDLVTSFLVAFAAVTTSELLARIWEAF